jgi:ubiquinone biosynthesis accessory factor UbiJ
MKIDPSLITAASAAAETLVNRVLMLDPSAQAKISELEGAVIKLKITPFGLAITIQACNTRLIVSGNDEKFTNSEIDACIEGSPLALSRLILDESQSILTSSSNIKLLGDEKKAHKFQSLLSELDLDWESALADIIGDIPAHFIGQRLRNSLQWSKQSQQSLIANIEEHLHEESKLLPNQFELEEQFAEISELSLSANKLKERLEKLESLKYI